ncbi:MAG: tetraacyldisaccharide 4'-kinase [Proteobacteria bacterium]|nr:tetraacyldisaccharide 4'-kinase [Pseudomonadota bacterium]
MRNCTGCSSKADGRPAAPAGDKLVRCDCLAAVATIKRGVRVGGARQTLGLPPGPPAVRAGGRAGDRGGQYQRGRHRQDSAGALAGAAVAGRGAARGRGVARPWRQAPARVPRLVSEADPADEVGDEALLLARRAECPVCVGVDRLAAARELVAAGCQVIVADDGLQHYALGRTLEIAVVDGARGLGNGTLLPAGPLREPPQRLREVDAVVLNGRLDRPMPASVAVGEKCLSMALQPRQFVRLATGEGASIPTWRGRSVHAVAAIGNPDRFFATLRTLGIDAVEHAFADHHRFGPGDLAFGDERDIVMTEKDAVKCAGFASDRMWYLSAAIHFEAADAARLMALVRARLAEEQGT